MSSGRRAVIACQRRAGAVEEHPELGLRDVEYVRLRCVGQLNEGLLLGLLARGSPAILVAGCTEDRCRFGEGARLARRAVRRAREILRRGGLDPQCIVFDGSDRRAHDPLGPTLERFGRQRHFVTACDTSEEVDEK